MSKFEVYSFYTFIMLSLQIMAYYIMILLYIKRKGGIGMMISSESFYEKYLKGKDAEQIMTVIRGLKQKIGRLKNIVEHPEYKRTVCPSEEVRIYCFRDYPERAKRAFADAGGKYSFSVAEKRALDFEASVPFISRIEFCIGGYFNGYTTKTYTIDGDKAYYRAVEHLLNPDPLARNDFETEEINKDDLL